MIIKKAAGLIIQDEKMLMCKKADEDFFIMPGGKIEADETSEQALIRELSEELSVSVSSASYIDTYKAPHVYKENVMIEMQVFLVEIEGIPVPTSEINELVWIDSKYEADNIPVSTINSLFVIPALHEKKLIG